MLLRRKKSGSGISGIRGNNMVIKLSFQDIEDIIKKRLPMSGVDANFHWNPEQIDLNKTSTLKNDIILEVTTYYGF